METILSTLFLDRQLRAVELTQVKFQAGIGTGHSKGEQQREDGR